MFMQNYVTLYILYYRGSYEGAKFSGLYCKVQDLVQNPFFDGETLLDCHLLPISGGMTCQNRIDYP